MTGLCEVDRSFRAVTEVVLELEMVGTIVAEEVASSVVRDTETVDVAEGVGVVSEVVKTGVV